MMLRLLTMALATFPTVAMAGTCPDANLPCNCQVFTVGESLETPKRLSLLTTEWKAGQPITLEIEAAFVHRATQAYVRIASVSGKSPPVSPLRVTLPPQHVAGDRFRITTEPLPRFLDDRLNPTWRVVGLSFLTKFRCVKPVGITRDHLEIDLRVCPSGKKCYAVTTLSRDKPTRFSEMRAHLRPNKQRDSSPPVVNHFGLFQDTAPQHRHCYSFVLIASDNLSGIGSRAGWGVVDHIGPGGSLSNVSSGALDGFSRESRPKSGNFAVNHLLRRVATCADSRPTAPGSYQYSKVIIQDRAGNRALLIADSGTQKHYKNNEGQRTKIPVVRFKGGQ
jgi:hypothetical protein